MLEMSTFPETLVLIKAILRKLDTKKDIEKCHLY